MCVCACEFSVTPRCTIIQVSDTISYEEIREILSTCLRDESESVLNHVYGMMMQDLSVVEIKDFASSSRESQMALVGRYEKALAYWSCLPEYYDIIEDQPDRKIVNALLDLPWEAVELQTASRENMHKAVNARRREPSRH